MLHYSFHKSRFLTKAFPNGPPIQIFRPTPIVTTNHVHSTRSTNTDFPLTHRTNSYFSAGQSGLKIDRHTCIIAQVHLVLCFAVALFSKEPVPLTSVVIRRLICNNPEPIWQGGNAGQCGIQRKKAWRWLLNNEDAINVWWDGRTMWVQVLREATYCYVGRVLIREIWRPPPPLSTSLQRSLSDLTWPYSDPDIEIDPSDLSPADLIWYSTVSKLVTSLTQRFCGVKLFETLCVLYRYYMRHRLTPHALDTGAMKIAD